MPIRSPWMDLTNGINDAGGRMQQMIVNMAQQKRQSELETAKLYVAAMVAAAQTKQHEALAKRYESETAGETLKVSAAQDYGKALSDKMFQRPDAVMNLAQTATLADEARAAAIIKALAGKADPYEMHNIPANTYGMNTMTGDLTPGMLEVNTGQTLFNPRTLRPMAAGGFSLNPGQLRFGATGGEGMPEVMGRGAVRTSTVNPVSAWNTTIRALSGQYSIDNPDVQAQLESIATNMPASFMPTNTPSRPVNKRPTRKQAADYVKRFGNREAALQALTKEGYDVSGYAD